MNGVPKFQRPILQHPVMRALQRSNQGLPLIKVKNARTSAHTEGDMEVYGKLDAHYNHLVAAHELQLKKMMILD